MRIIGFNYTKISAERPVKFTKVEKITQNVEFVDVEKDELSLMKDSSVLRVSFAYEMQYEPIKAAIKLEGLILIHTDNETIKKAQKAWKKKEIENDMKVFLLRLILNKCSLKALNLEEELGLPPHMKLVKLNVESPQ